MDEEQYSGAARATDAIEDSELLARWLSGDRHAGDVLVTRHARRVYALCVRYFGDPVDAEDAAQETFLTLIRRGETYQGGAAFSTWLHRVAVNTCHDLARRRSRRPAPTPIEVERGGAPTTDGGLDRVDELLDARALRPALRTALDELDADQRVAVVLRDVGGLGYAELARELGVAVGTAKSRVHRGHARLAAVLADAGVAAGTDQNAHDSNPVSDDRPRHE